MTARPVDRTPPAELAPRRAGRHCRRPTPPPPPGGLAAGWCHEFAGKNQV